VVTRLNNYKFVAIFYSAALFFWIFTARY